MTKRSIPQVGPKETRKLWRVSITYRGAVLAETDEEAADLAEQLPAHSAKTAEIEIDPYLGHGIEFLRYPSDAPVIHDGEEEITLREAERIHAKAMGGGR